MRNKPWTYETAHGKIFRQSCGNGWYVYFASKITPDGTYSAIIGPFSTRHTAQKAITESWTYETANGYVRKVAYGWAHYAWYAGKSTPDGGYAPEIGAFATRSEALAAISA